jgi:hypothetical protein
MKKNKKNKAGKKTTLFSGAAKSLKRLGKSKKNGGFSTTQKVVGGAALVALGLSYLNTRRGKTSSAAETTPDATAAEENLAGLDGNA